MLTERWMRVWRVLGLLLLAGGCGVAQESAKKPAPASLITTPATYYSSPKAKLLGAKYHDNLDRLVERIVRNTKTTGLQFANNIASVGGIGFFTHSATKLADERFLEVVLAAPDAFETRGDYSPKLLRLFATYGNELLAILTSDTAIFEDKDVSGYALNFSWRSLGAEAGAGGRVTVERAVAYLPKDRVRAFLRRELTQNRLLAEAVIFAGQENGPLTLVSYIAQQPQPDFRAPIQDETLAGPAEPRDGEPQAKKPNPLRVAENEQPPPDETSRQAPPAATEKKPPVSKPVSVAATEPQPATAKPAAQNGMKAQEIAVVRPQPQPSKATQATAPLNAAGGDAKPAAGQTAAATGKAAPAAQPSKTESAPTVSNKPSVQPSPIAAPVQREKTAGADPKERKTESLGHPVESGTKTENRTETAKKIAFPDRPPQPRLEPTNH
jgi:hypothetical protein